MPDVFFILLLALVLLGPKKLPQVAGQIGKYLAQFQRMRRELLDQVSAEVARMESQAEPTTAPVPAPPKAAETRAEIVEGNLSSELGSD